MTSQTIASVVKPRILCVDDNRDFADSLVMLLNLCDFDAQACYDGPSALQRAHECLPDLCFIDLNMPGMDGDELALRLREIAGERSLGLVALTAMGSGVAYDRTAAAGFTRHLVKPPDPEQLLLIASELV